MDLVSVVRESWNGYQHLQAAHPYVGSMLTAEVTFVLGDVASQLYVDGKLNPKKLAYTASLCPLYGAGLQGLMETGDIAGRLVSENPMVKAALGPNLWGNLYNVFFFVNNTVGERLGYGWKGLKGLASNYASLLMRDKDAEMHLPYQDVSLKARVRKSILDNVPRAEYLESLFWTLTLWNGIQAANYYYVADEFRAPVSMGAGLLWGFYLTMRSQKGSRKKVKETLAAAAE